MDITFPPFPLDLLSESLSSAQQYIFDGISHIFNILSSQIPVLSLKLLILSLITAKRQLIHDRTASRDSWLQSYDFIVVGAGTAGSTIAGRLSENPNGKVLLLEAGGPQSALWTDMSGLDHSIREGMPNIEYFYYSERQQNAGHIFAGGRPLEPLGKVLGGTSSHNTLIFNRGNKRDYDEWANTYGVSGWSYREVLPFFKKYENNRDSNLVRMSPGYHGTDGPVKISTLYRPRKILSLVQKSFNELGHNNTDVNGAKQAGTMILQRFSDDYGLRSSAANAYIDPNPHPNNLHILTKALVVKILFNGLTAVGVEFSMNNRLLRVNVRKEVILTAGAVNSAKLLMLSGIGIRSHLNEMGIPLRLDLPVGNNYMNHPELIAQSQIKDPAYFYELPILSLRLVSKFYLEGRGRLSESPYLGLYFSTKGNNETDWPNIMLLHRNSNDTLISIPNLVRIRSRGTVRLQSTSPYDQPRLDPAFLAHPLDFEDFVEGVEYMFYILEKSSIAPYVTPPSFESIGCPVCPNKYRYECREGIECFIRSKTQTSYHPCCSNRMGAVDRDDVVVDPFLRVKNAKQLRVCDSSVFPSIPNSNTNAPTFMVAEKCAQIIKDCYRL